MTINTLPEQIHPCKCGSASMMIEASFNCIYGEYMYAIIRCHQCNRAVSSTSLLGACIRWNDTMITEKEDDN